MTKNSEQKTDEARSCAAAGYARAVDAAIAYMTNDPEWHTEAGMNLHDDLQRAIGESDLYTNAGHLLACEVLRLRAALMRIGDMPALNAYSADDMKKVAREAVELKSHNDKMSGRAAQKGEHE